MAAPDSNVNPGSKNATINRGATTDQKARRHAGGVALYN